jgi:hypothetical protein
LFRHLPARHDDEAGGARDSANDDQRQAEQEAGDQAWQAAGIVNLGVIAGRLSSWKQSSTLSDWEFQGLPRRIAMNQYVRLDVSQEQTSICVVNERGRVLWQGKCTTAPEALTATLRIRAPQAERKQ